MLAFLLVAGAYSNHFAGRFHFDDGHVIEQNLYLRSLANIPRFFGDATTFSSLPANATYRPLLSVTYALDYAIGGGLAPWSFHLTQFLIHLAVGVCVFLFIAGVLRRTAPSPANRWAALAGATLFAVHTANTETVNYLSARSDALSTLCLLVGFLIYMERPEARRLHLHALPMLVGALAKTPAVLLGPLLLLYALLIEEGLSLGEVVRLRPWARIRAALARTAPTIALGVVAFLFVEGMNPETQSYGGPARALYARTQLWVTLRYLGLFLVPVGLTADTDVEPIRPLADPRVLLGALGVVTLVAVAWIASRRPRGRALAFGVLWFYVGLLPSSSVFPLAETMNEHRIYLPFVGLTLAAATLLASATARAAAGPAAAAPDSATGGWPVRLVAGAAALVIVAHAVGTFARNRVWRTEETLWADVVEKSPNNGRAWMNYGLTQMQVGSYDRALELFRQSARLVPAYWYVYTNLGIVLDALGRPDEAEGELRHALLLQPTFVEGHYYLARFLARHGRALEALDHARRACELSPGYGPARTLVLDLLYASGRRDELRAEAAATLAILPSHSEALAYAGGAPALAETSPTALAALAENWQSSGDPLAAAVARRRAAELTPTPELLDALDRSLGALGLPPAAR